MLKPQSPWIDFHGILDHNPDRPVHSRMILKNELVLEIDSDDWTEVRDGTMSVIAILNEWGAEGSYYLSFSGNHSIHVHVFMDISSVRIRDDVAQLLQGRDDVSAAFKSYLTLQIARASGAVVDMQLTGKHMIRMEGGFNEKSKRYCTMISNVPEEKPKYYDISVPSMMPSKLWNLSRFESEINAFLKVHYEIRQKRVYRFFGKPIDPEPLKEVLMPVFIPGYRHFIVMSLAGWLRRHSVPEEKTRDIVRALSSYDKTPAKTSWTIREVYNSKETERIPGLPKLIEIVNLIRRDGKISESTATGVIDTLEIINRGGKLT